jgi:hypothetical protein
MLTVAHASDMNACELALYGAIHELGEAEGALAQSNMKRTAARVAFLKGLCRQFLAEMHQAFREAGEFLARHQDAGPSF